MYVSDSVLLLLGLLQQYCAILRNSASLAWRCAEYERKSNLFDLENGVHKGLCPYIRRNGRGVNRGVMSIQNKWYM